MSHQFLFLIIRIKFELQIIWEFAFLMLCESKRFSHWLIWCISASVIDITRTVAEWWRRVALAPSDSTGGFPIVIARMHGLNALARCFSCCWHIPPFHISTPPSRHSLIRLSKPLVRFSASPSSSTSTSIKRNAPRIKSISIKENAVRKEIL